MSGGDEETMAIEVIRVHEWILKCMEGALRVV